MQRVFKPTAGPRWPLPRPSTTGLFYTGCDLRAAPNRVCAGEGTRSNSLNLVGGLGWSIHTHYISTYACSHTIISLHTHTFGHLSFPGNHSRARIVATPVGQRTRSDAKWRIHFFNAQSTKTYVRKVYEACLFFTGPLKISPTLNIFISIFAFSMCNNDLQKCEKIAPWSSR